MSPTSCQTAPPRVRENGLYRDVRKTSNNRGTYFKRRVRARSRSKILDGGAFHFAVDNVRAVLARTAFCHAEIGERGRQHKAKYAARFRAADRARPADAHRDVVTFGMALVAVEFVERPRKHQRMHFEVLIKGWIEFGHDVSRCVSANVVPLY